MGERISYKWHFIGSLIIVSLITIVGFVWLADSYHNRLNRIEKIQTADCKQIKSIFNTYATYANNNRIINAGIERVSEVLENHEERMESLMEFEFEKLQNDFNLISLWAGIITIVFLVFSIYSIFKTDEMLKESEAVYGQIKGKANEIESLTQYLQNNYQENLKSIKKESDNHMKEMSQKMSLLNERLANADMLIRQYREAAQTDETLQTSNEEQDIQDNRE